MNFPPSRPVVVSAALAAALGLTLSMASLGARADEVRIGFLATMSGPGGSLGQDQYDGFMLGVANAGGKLGGQEIRVFRKDDELKPELGKQAARELIDNDKVTIVTGLSFSNVLMAVQKDVLSSGTLLISNNAGPSQLAGESCSPMYYSTSWQNDQVHGAMGKYAQDKGFRHVALMAPNYQAGKEALIGFKRFFKGEIVSETYTTVNQADYSVEITRVQSLKPDAVFVFYPGGMGVNFVKQYGQADMLGKVPLLSGATVDGTTLPALGQLAVGVLSAGPWSTDLQNASSRKFVETFKARYGRTPSAYAAYAYDTAQLLDAGIRANAGRSDAASLAPVLARVSFPSVRGNFRFNNNHFAVSNYYAIEVVKNESGGADLATKDTIFTDFQDPYHQQCTMP